MVVTPRKRAREEDAEDAALFRYEEHEEGGGGDGEAKVVLLLDHVRGFMSALQGLQWRGQGAGGAGEAKGEARGERVVGRAGSKVHCELQFDASGLSVCVEDDSKAVQAVAFLRSADHMRVYRYAGGSGPTRVGVSLRRLVDALQPFAAATSGAPLGMRYPDGDGGIVFTMDESDPPLRLSAELRTTEPRLGAMFQDYSDASVAASFAMHGGLIKEVVEDLGWPKAPVVISVSRRPPMLTLKASGDTGGELEVQLDLETRDLDMGVNWEMDRDVECVCFRYKHKYLAAALCNFQAEYAGGKLRTRISIDKAGIMSVQHLVNITEQASDMLHMQGANKLSMHVKFCILPEEEDLDDDDGL